MGWSAIADTEIAQYKPITARLMRKLRNRDRAARRFTLQGFITGGISGFGGGNGDTSGAYVDADTFDIYVPGYLIGDNGTTLTIKPDLEATVAGTGNATVYCRLKHGSDYSDEAGPVVQTGTGSNRAEVDTMALTFTPTADTINSVTIQVKVATSATILGTATVYAPNDRCTNWITEAG